MKTLLFTDIDDTLIRSKEKCSEGACLEPAGFLKDGCVHSYTEAHHRQFIELMAAQAEFIPTTARNRDSFDRVRLPVGEYPWAILNHGATILDKSGRRDDIWHRQMMAHSEVHREVLQAWFDRAQVEFVKQGGLSLNIRLQSEEALLLGILVKDRERNLENLSLVESFFRLQPEVASGAFQVLSNGNNLMVLPSAINKSAAVSHLIERYRQEDRNLLILGAGDSLSDLPFMSLCHYALIPPQSQIFEQIKED